MEKAFEKFMQRDAVRKEFENKPLLKATFMSLYQFVLNGGKLEDLPWFVLSKELKQAQLKKAA